MAQWKWITQARNGAQIADVTALRDRKLTFQLNRPCMVTASLRADDPRALRDSLGGLQSGVHELVVYRDQAPQETVFQLAKADVSAGVDSMRINFEWQGIASYLQDALIYPQASAYSSTTLPWTWINTFQTRTGGGYGITQGSVTGAAPSRTKTVQQEAELLATITELSESSNGFDYAINAARQYVEWHTQRGADNGIVLEYGVNVADFSYTESTGPGEIVNAVFVVGPPGTGVATATNSPSRTTYGRREAATTFFADFDGAGITTGQLQAHADAAIRERINPIIIPQVRLISTHQSIPWGSYWLGDTITFRATIGEYQTINQQYRIIQIDVDLDDNDNETITLGLNAA